MAELTMKEAAARRHAETIAQPVGAPWSNPCPYGDGKFEITAPMLATGQHRHVAVFVNLEDARRVTRAINAHDELLLVLRTARDALSSAIRANVGPELGFDSAEHTVIRQIDAAIAKAQG